MRRAGSSPLSSPILDSHCHAWRRWPYPPPVPDSESRGTIDQLVYEMDGNGVSQALVVCAAIDDNPDNTAYVVSCLERHPGRFHVVADLDCTWSGTYHLPGSADRLRALDDRYELAGVHPLRRRAQRRLAFERRGGRSLCRRFRTRIVREPRRRAGLAGRPAPDRPPTPGSAGALPPSRRCPCRRPRWARRGPRLGLGPQHLREGFRVPLRLGDELRTTLGRTRWRR